MSSKKRLYDLEILQGATFKLTLTYKDASGATLIESGDTVRMQIRAEQSQTASLLLDCTSYMTISTISISVVIPATVTAGLSFTSGYYDVELVKTDGTVTRLIQGAVTVDKGVTA